DGHSRLIELNLVAMNNDAVFGCEQDVIIHIACERPLQVDADYFELPVLSLAENLNIIELSVRRNPARKVDGIPQVNRAVSHVIARIAYLSAHGHNWSMFKIVGPKKPSRSHRLQDQFLLA